MIELADAGVTVGKFCLGPLSLQIERGAYVLLVGPSGAGKSLLLSALCGVRRLDRGTLALRGQPATRLPAARRRCGWVPQSPTLFPHLTVRENVAYGLCCLGLDASSRRERLERWGESLELQALWQRWPADLSGGEAQRVALARALAPQNDLLLLDEPLSALDLGRRQRLGEWLRTLHKDLGLTIVHVTHDFDEARACPGRVVAMAAGRIVQIGTLQDIVQNPADPALAAAFAPRRDVSA